MYEIKIDGIHVANLPLHPQPEETMSPCDYVVENFKPDVFHTWPALPEENSIVTVYDRKQRCTVLEAIVDHSDETHMKTYAIQPPGEPLCEIVIQWNTVVKDKIGSILDKHSIFPIEIFIRYPSWVAMERSEKKFTVPNCFNFDDDDDVEADIE